MSQQCSRLYGAAVHPPALRNATTTMLHTRRHRRIVACVGGVALVALAVACDALWVDDTPRQTLAFNDFFDVSPPCPVLAIDSNALAAVEPTITILARRRETNLGAESVPVDVTIGSCRCLQARLSDGALASSLDAASEGGSEALEPQCSNAPNSCTEGLQAMDPARITEFELIATPGCQQASTTKLSCSLDPNGQASFRVRSVNPNAPALLPEYLPICVHPAAFGNSNILDREVRLLRRESTARFALGVASVPNVTAPGPDGGSCASLSNCNAPVPRARFSAGVVNIDTPARALREDDFVTLLRDVSVTVALSAPSEGAFLTTSTSCTPGDGGTALASLDLQIARGQRGSVPFNLCASETSGSFRLSAKLTGAIPDAGESVSVESRNNDVSIQAAIKGYSIGNDGVVSKTTCDGTTTPARPPEFRSVTPGTFDNDTVVIPCRADAGVGDAGAACEVNLALASGGTCSL